MSFKCSQVEQLVSFVVFEVYCCLWVSIASSVPLLVDTCWPTWWNKNQYWCYTSQTAARAFSVKWRYACDVECSGKWVTDQRRDGSGTPAPTHHWKVAVFHVTVNIFTCTVPHGAILSHTVQHGPTWYHMVMSCNSEFNHMVQYCHTWYHVVRSLNWPLEWHER